MDKVNEKLWCIANCRNLWNQAQQLAHVLFLASAWLCCQAWFSDWGLHPRSINPHTLLQLALHWSLLLCPPPKCLWTIPNNYYNACMSSWSHWPTLPLAQARISMNPDLPSCFLLLYVLEIGTKRFLVGPADEVLKLRWMYQIIYCIIIVDHLWDPRVSSSTWFHWLACLLEEALQEKTKEVNWWDVCLPVELKNCQRCQ